MSGSQILKLLPIVHRIRFVTKCTGSQVYSINARSEKNKTFQRSYSSKKQYGISDGHDLCPPSWKRSERQYCTSGGTPPKQEILTELSDADYEDVSEDTLDAITEKFEDLADSNLTSSEYDVNFASGVITIKLGGSLGTYVINKQSPNKQIWLSSPVSGPKRYDYIKGTWIYKHDGQTLHSLLTREISEAFKTNIDFNECVYGKEES